MKTIYKIITVVVMLAAVILGLRIWISPDADRITVYPAKLRM